MKDRLAWIAIGVAVLAAPALAQKAPAKRPARVSVDRTAVPSGAGWWCDAAACTRLERAGATAQASAFVHTAIVAEARAARAFAAPTLEACRAAVAAHAADGGHRAISACEEIAASAGPYDGLTQAWCYQVREQGARAAIGLCLPDAAACDRAIEANDTRVATIERTCRARAGAWAFHTPGASFLGEGRPDCQALRERVGGDGACVAVGAP